VGAEGHTLPFLIKSFDAALLAAAIIVVLELISICWIRHRYMGTRPLSAALQVGLGGVLVFVTGVLIGRS
jgi:erythrin-vacuolar iron transport family protein